MRLKKLKLSSFLLLGVGLTGLQAQETIPATGGNASGSGGSVMFSVGQVVYTTNTGTNGNVVQGVQQPYEIWLITAMEEPKGKNPIMVKAYPNPATELLTLKVDNYEKEEFSYQLYDMNGKLIKNKNIEGRQTKIVMRNLVPSTYYLKVTNGKKANKTFKIIKN